MNTENNTSKANTNDYEIDTLTNQRLIKDHEYDSIKELDNDLPPWWKWLFILTVVFAVVYLIRLYVFKADDLIQKSEYNIEMADVKAKEAAKPVVAFELVLLTDEASMANGKDTWMKICSVCHLADGGGLVGPNMTDKYWIHGNKLSDLYNTVTVGVPDKGMLSYKDQLSPQQRLEAVSYILNKIQGTTPATPKAPQGDLYE